mmetsp:Transcript_35369/g.82544  ORF Transcript_35369/g.82544 Transcript_35369/m.82544 type:complete len:91 (+) Transcript_35369:1238-1510(+)
MHYRFESLKPFLYSAMLCKVRGACCRACILELDGTYMPNCAIAGEQLDLHLKNVLADLLPGRVRKLGHCGTWPSDSLTDDILCKAWYPGL